MHSNWPHIIIFLSYFLVYHITPSPWVSLLRNFIVFCNFRQCFVHILRSPCTGLPSKSFFFCSLQKTIRNTNLQTNRRCNAVVNCDGICDMREVTAENSKISPTYINKQVVGPSLYRALQEAAKAKRIHGNGMLLLLYIFECETHDELTSTTTSKELFLSEILPSFCSTLALNTSYYCYGGYECSIVTNALYMEKS